MRTLSICCVVLAAHLCTACAGRPSILPNADKSLRRSSAQFAADAALRHPYKSDAPRGGEAIARSQVGYTLNRIEIVNLGPDDWNDVEIWVNQDYVVHLPKMESKKLKTIEFTMLYNGKGDYFPLNNNKVLVKKVEVYRDGKMFDVPVKLGD